MDLELLTRQPASDPRATPLLFVHGAWHGAWCWEEHFLPWFAGRGYAAHAVSLRGHGKSPQPGQPRRMRISDYVEDVARVVETLPAAPVLVGHSMGGLVVQKALEGNPAPAAVLLAPVPVGGVVATALRFARRHPWLFARANLTWSLYPFVGSPALAREAFFSTDIAPDTLKRHFTRIQDESYLAFLDMLLFRLPRPERVRTPLLVLGAADDTIFLPREIERTARAYGTRAEIVPGMAHDMMLESGWEAVATRILAWLESRGL